MSGDAWGKVGTVLGLVLLFSVGPKIKAMLFSPRPPAAASSGSVSQATPAAAAAAPALTDSEHNAISLIISQGGSRESYFGNRDFLIGRGDSNDQATSFLLAVAQMTPGTGIEAALFVGVTLRKAFSADTALTKLQAILSADSEVPGLGALQCAVIAAKGEPYDVKTASTMFAYFNRTGKRAEFGTAIDAVAYARAQP